ncbi:MAG: hypothetical protein HFJ10_05285 [Lachnospiraceae bacterium]|jgi:hypothetical protein|nr:hypothetical protein [Lachnospiraceae bacterium]
MTIRERMLSAYRGKAQDRPALGIYARYLPHGAIERQVRNLGLGIIEYVPITSQIGPPWHMLPGFLSEIPGVELQSRYHWVKGNLREIRTFSSEKGSVFTEIGSSKGAGSEHIGSYYIKSLEDYKSMKELVEKAILHPNTELYLNTAERLGEDGVVMGRMDRTPYQKLLLELAGAQQFLVDLYTEPEIVEELMEALGKRYKEQVDIMAESPAEIIWMPDNVTVDMTPPKAFRKYLLEYYQYCVTCAHEAGKLVAAHFDGKIRPLISEIKESGIDIIESVSEPRIGGDMGYWEAQETFQEQVVLPNFPANLSYESDEAIHAYFTDLREKVGERPFMLQISEDLPDGTWQRMIPLITKYMYE